MINVNVKPVFTSRKLLQTLSVKENKPPIVNTQCVVYSFQCDLCYTNYVAFTARHLHQRISEHRYSPIGKHLQTQHDNKRAKTDHLFKVLKKCRSKFDCLVYEMLFIKDIKASLNTQSDSIRAKLLLDTFVPFVSFFYCSFCLAFAYYTHRTHKYFDCFTFYILFELLSS